jgi:hypothetical protein
MDNTSDETWESISEKAGVFPKPRSRNRKGKITRFDNGRIKTIPGKVSPGDQEMGPVSAKTLTGRR